MEIPIQKVFVAVVVVVAVAVAAAESVAVAVVTKAVAVANFKPLALLFGSTTCFQSCPMMGCASEAGAWSWSRWRGQQD